MSLTSSISSLSRRLFPRACVSTLCFFIAFSAYSRDVVEEEERLRTIQSEIKSTEKSITFAEDEKNDIQAALEQAEKRISHIGRRLHVIRKDYEIQERQLEKLQKEVDARQAVLRQEQRRLTKLVRSAFQMDRHGELRMLLNQESPALFRRMLAYHDYFNRQRVRQIDVVNERLAALNKSRHALTLQARTLARLEDRRRKELVDLEHANKQRQVTLALINMDIEQQGEILSRLRKDEQALADIINSLVDLLSDVPKDSGEQKRFAQLKGLLKWPSDGKLITRFGSKRGDTGKKWSGVVIGAKRGSQVEAIARGRVAFSDWLRGYGLLIILDHGDGYMSLYGHNESIYKDTGEWVESGEVIASVGDSGAQQRTGLYFEIRKSGKPVNPVKWCAKGNKPTAS